MNSIVRHVLLVVLVVGGTKVDGQECAGDANAPHSPTTVFYGNGPNGQSTILSPQRDGSVQATDASSGATLWVFTPPDVDVSTSGDRITDLRVLRFDANGDGTIDIIAGDKVWLYFGTRQGGPFYYA